MKEVIDKQEQALVYKKKMLALKKIMGSNSAI